MYSVGSPGRVGEEILNLSYIIGSRAGDSEPAGVYIFFYGKGNEHHELGTGLFVHKRIISAVKRVEFVSDRMSYIVLRDRWCNIIGLNVHAPTEDKIDDIKDMFYEELERVFDKFPRYHMKMLLGEFDAKVGRKYIFKPRVGNESLHEISNDSGVRVITFATAISPNCQKYDVSKS
jgi:hypothetical protein